MKLYEIKSVTTSREILKTITCDICGATSDSEWSSGSYDAVESTIELKTGSCYPDGGSGEKIIIDICPNCFVEKLVPWVEKHGGKPTKKEWDY